MAGHKLRVRIEKIIPEFNVNETFSKGEMIGVIDGEYPENYLFEFPKDKAKLLDDVLEGTYVTVHFNYRTNVTESTTNKDRGNYFLSLSAWKIEA